MGGHPTFGVGIGKRGQVGVQGSGTTLPCAAALGGGWGAWKASPEIPQI
jgi:hypothetical protein